MPAVDLIDETFIAAPPDRVAARVADPAQWARWWPGRRLDVFMDRGERGIRWSVNGDLVGSAEIWLEPVLDGTLVHYFVRAEPPRPSGDAPLSARRGARLRAREARRWKRQVWALKDELEARRRPGEPADPSAAGRDPAVKSED